MESDLRRCLEALENLLSVEARRHNYTLDAGGEITSCSGCDPERVARVLLVELRKRYPREEHDA